MKPEVLGNEILDIFEGVDMRQFVYCLRNMLLDYIAKNVRNGLPYDLEEYMQELLMLYYVLEDLPTQKKSRKK